MCVVGEEIVKMTHAFMEHGMLIHQLAEGRAFVLFGQEAVHQQVGHVKEVAALGQFVDVVTAVAQNAFFAVDERDIAAAGAGVGIARIVGDQAALGAQLLDIHGDFAFTAFIDGQFIDLAIEFQFGLGYFLGVHHVRGLTFLGAPSAGC